MADIMQTNRVLHGSTGVTWLNDKKLANLKSIKTRLKAQVEPYSCAGDFRTFWSYTGYEITGTLALHKVDSQTLSLMKDAYKTGQIPTIKIITKLTDIQSGQSERVALIDVIFEEIDLANFEAKMQSGEELPFRAVEYDILEEIA